jgi:hypothetical protein
VSRSKKLFSLILFASIFAIILGEKFMLIDRYGSDLPFWDQWDAEGDYLFRPYLEGGLTTKDLFAAHNEHRIFFTRVLALGLFEANDHQWDARVELLVNTVLHASVALLLVALALRALPLRFATAFAAMAALFFSTSVSFENTLAGFQSQFYFLLLFSTLHIGGTLIARPRSLLWWLAPLAGLAALFSMASGLLSAVAILGATGLWILCKRKLTRDDLWVLTANFALCVIGWLFKVEVSYHEGLKAAGLLPWLDAWLHQLSWPVKNIWLAPLGLVAPLLLGGAFLLRRIKGPLAMALLAACAWVWLQTAAIAYARGAIEHGYAPRYTDLLAIGILVNFLVFAYLAVNAPSRRLYDWGISVTAAFAGITLWGLSIETTITEQGTLNQLGDINNARIASVRDYLATREPSFFTKTPWSELPYPSAEHLAGLLDKPILRGMLPSSVRPPLAIVADSAGNQGFAEYHSGGPLSPAPLALNAWLTPPREGAASSDRFSSELVVVEHHRVGLFVATNAPHDDVHLRLIDEKGLGYEPLENDFLAGPKWKRLNFYVPLGRYRLEVSHTGTGWFAFTQPMTDTSLSHFAIKAVRSGPWVFGGGMGLGFVALLLLLTRMDDRSGLLDTREP